MDRFLPSCCLLLLLFAASFLAAQDQTDWEGKWSGAIEIPGTELPLFIELSFTDGAWSGTLDISSQRIDDMALAELELTADSLAFYLPEVPGTARFTGLRRQDTIRGTFRQMGQELPLVLQREDIALLARMDAKLARIRSLVDSFIVGAKVPGLALGVLYEGEPVLLDGFGYRNLEEREPVTPQTNFAIGSSSKAFTTLGLGLLVDEGLLEWNRPVKEYLPDFQLHDPFATAEMTAIDLVTHRSGLPRHDLMWYATDFDRETLYHKLRFLEPTESFRTTFQYQNLMYMTAGYLTEHLTGQSWEAYIQQRIFDPLGMNTANFSVDSLRKRPDFAYGYDEREEELVRLPFRNIDAIGPAGSINASIEDMLPWLELHLGTGEVNGQHYINAATLLKMHQPHMLMDGPLIRLPSLSHSSYGLGWFLYDYDGLDVVEHGGNIDGFSALVFMIPEQQLGITILTNRNGTALPYLLAYTITDILLDRDDNDWYGILFGEGAQEEEEIADVPEAEEIDEETADQDERRVAGTSHQHPLEDYTGVYVHPAYGEISITLEAEQLLLTYFDFQLPLNHYHFETFQGKVDSINIEVKPNFITNTAGKVVALEEVMEPSLPAMRFEKQPADRLSDPQFLQTLTGRYRFGDQGPIISVELVGDHLQATIPGQPTYDLEPIDGTEFHYKQLPDTYTIGFILENDKPVAIVSYQPNGTFRATRIEETNEDE